MAATSPAKHAYQVLAPFYDQVKRDDDYAVTARRVAGEIRRVSPSAKRLLDVGCGTGLSSAALCIEGFEVSGCDVSTAMIELALKRPELIGRPFAAADMRDMPSPRKPFDVVTCIDDVINYLLEPTDLRLAFGAIRRQLAPGGVFAFDVNSHRTFLTQFSAAAGTRHVGEHLQWRGLGSGDEPAGSLFGLDIVGRSDGEPDGPQVVSHHIQRHWPIAELASLLEESDFVPVAVRGVLGRSHRSDFDDDQDVKALVIAQGGVTANGVAHRSDGRVARAEYASNGPACTN